MPQPYLDPAPGGRRQEIVFVGCDPMSEEQIRRAFDACLVDASAFGPGECSGFGYPFPSRGQAPALTH